MSELAPYMVWPPFAGPRNQRLRRVAASATFFGVVAVAAVLTAVAAWQGLGQLRAMSGEFWVLAALAVVADVVPFRLPPPARRTTTFLFSPCFCFAIMLLYPPASAIVIQVVAIAVAAPRLHMRWPALAFLTARLVCSLAFAGWVDDLLGVRTADIRDHPSLAADIGAVVVALNFLAVTVLISVAGALLSSATRPEILRQLRVEVLARGSVLLIGVVIVSVPTAWSRSLLAVPLVGWWGLAHLLEDRQRRLGHDPVTGLYSRDGVAFAFEALPRIGHHDVDAWALIVVELRAIAQLRRTSGDVLVEHLTRALASRMRAVAPDRDRFGQLSETHFVVLRPVPADRDALDVALPVVAALSPPVEVDGVPYRLDPVAGVAVAPQHGDEFSQLVSCAEAALLEAELHQEPVWLYTEDAKSDVDDRAALLRDFTSTLRDPSAASDIVMLYQPQVALATGHTVSVEALLRWSNPTRGPVPTDSLIDLVEPTGVMQELTRYVLNRVVGQLAEWNREGIHLRAAVNVSVIDLVSTDDFEIQIANVLQTHRVPAWQLEIEITERAVVEATQVLDEAAHRLARLGVGLSLDDFGTGYASLHRLRQMPLAEVKIDRSYVSQIEQSPTDLAFVKTIHDLAAALGLRVVAEGVESERTARILADLGGVIGQGWLYAKPMTAQQLVAWLQAREQAAER
jgi:EAL domain-containing protein (putative c-di-GMP-specific phosphodiesterase class I)/GGDEF domain-containing protein